MFGLTKREQRWKAEQRAAEVLLPFLAEIVRTAADARIAEAQAQDAATLREENARLRAQLSGTQGEQKP